MRRSAREGTGSALGTGHETTVGFDLVPLCSCARDARLLQLLLLLVDERELLTELGLQLLQLRLLLVQLQLSLLH